MVEEALHIKWAWLGAKVYLESASSYESGFQTYTEKCVCV